MYVVYWIETHPAHTEQSQHAWYALTGEMLGLTETRETVHHRRFDTSQMTEVLAYMEHLRTLRRAGYPLSFVSMCSEHPDSVGQPGVSDKLPDGYDWSKQDRAGLPRRR